MSRFQRYRLFGGGGAAPDTKLREATPACGNDIGASGEFVIVRGHEAGSTEHLMSQILVELREINANLKMLRRTARD